ncbi:hypothetical protein JXI42_07560 [bacterium]|nr:hypothetical protein [bacterium]
MRRIIAWILILMFISFLVITCGGGKKLATEYFQNGVMISFKPSVGDTLPYKKDADILAEVSSPQGSQSSLAKTSDWRRVLVDEVKDNGEMTITVFFDKSEAGEFVNGQYIPSEDEDELVGEFLRVTLDSTGLLKDWNGLEGLGYDESGIDQGQEMANTFSAISLDYFPNKRVNVGDTWNKKTENSVNTEKGNTTRTTEKKYTVEDFVMYKGHKCAKLKVNITLTVSGEGEGEYEGDLYSSWSEGKGDGKGTTYFDFENGYLVESDLHWMLEFQITNMNQTSKEKTNYSFYQEQTANYKLQEVK